MDYPVSERRLEGIPVANPNPLARVRTLKAETRGAEDDYRHMLGEWNQPAIKVVETASV